MRRIRRNDMVIIIAGTDKGKTGKVVKVLPGEDRVIVEQANLKKKHQRPTQANRTGGIVDVEAPIHISNVQLLDGKTNKGTRIKVSVGKDGEKVRVAAKSGTTFE